MADHPPPMKHRKSALLAVAGAYNDQVDELSTLRARIGELEAENARLKGDAEGQTVEGGDLSADILRVKRRAIMCMMDGMHVDGNTLSRWLDAASTLEHQAAELTRLKAAQPEHDRTVREKALEEAAKVAELMYTHFYSDKARIAKAIRSLIDQTGKEGGI